VTDPTMLQRPPVFASAEIRVRRVGDPVTGCCALLSVAGITVTLSEQEARALCTQLRDALNVTPEVTRR
jgi:hypothetical protein